MSETVIRVEGLSKQYEINHAAQSYQTLRDSLVHLAQSPLRRLRGETAPRSELLWALKDVNFDVPAGEVMGIIGRNGAGKSTLLKILSRITEPTSGRARIRGRVASLLEVGTGFHAELSGRENLYLNGAILGMTRREIDRKLDEIVAFAEVEKFIDTPVKRYSSGMYLRLAFAVAAHLEPEVLVVDEVLAVGDASFQRKCIQKMDNVSRQGRTVLFVSHNLGAVTSLCQSVIWLHQGQLRRRGESRAVVQEYLSEQLTLENGPIDLACLPRQRPQFGARVKIVSAELQPVPVRHGHSVLARVELDVLSSVEEITIGIGFSTLEGTRLLTYESDYPGGHRPDLARAGKCVLECEIPQLPLPPGHYALDFGARSGDMFAADYIGQAAQIEVLPGDATPGYFSRPNGGVRLPASFTWPGAALA